MSTNPDARDRVAEARWLRNQWWLSTCLLETKKKNLHQLALYVEPGLHWRSPETGDASWTNKWREYQKGVRTPSPALLNKVALLQVHGRPCSVTKRIFEHVVWAVLATPNPSQRLVAGWLEQLTPEFAELFSKTRWLPAQPGRAAIPDFGLRSFKTILCRTDLSALALATLVLLQAHNRRSHTLAEHAAAAVFKLLHTMFPTLSDLGLAEATMSFFQRHILDCRPTESFGYFRFLGDDIEARVGKLRRFIDYAQNAGLINTKQDAEREIRALLAGKSGLEFVDLFGLPMRRGGDQVHALSLGAVRER